jgi:hypothetical protein
MKGVLVHGKTYISITLKYWNNITN